MPRATLDRLPAKKRRRVLDAAIAEFADHPYDRVSLDRVAAAAGVPKGSLYQYFHHKRDCFNTAVADAFGAAFAEFERYLRRSRAGDCFDEFRHALLFAIVLRARRPLIARLYFRVGFLESAELQQEIVNRNSLFQQRWLERGIAEGLLDPRIDRTSVRFLLDAVANRFHFMALSGTMSEGSLQRLARSLAQHLRHALVGGIR